MRIWQGIASWVARKNKAQTITGKWTFEDDITLSGTKKLMGGTA